MRKLLFITLAVVFSIKTAHAQDRKKIQALFSEEAFEIDGKLLEPQWQKAPVQSNFVQNFPTDTLPATQDTEFRILYNNDFLYVGLVMQTQSNEFITNSLQRDYRATGIDNISISIDTFNDGANAFLFGINPFGVMREGLIANGGSDSRDFSTSWDVKWWGEAHIAEGYYSAEFAIPMNSLKFQDGGTYWSINCYRSDTQTNERTIWSSVPQNQLIANLAFTGILEFERPLGDSSTSIAVIPFLTGGMSKDFENATDLNSISSFGADFKVPIGKGMNLDLTLNPDFSQVEVDNFITNLTRFEISLPERRQFFLDNNDLFGGFGGGRNANPFFSRRIGIAEDKEGNTIENPIIAGARLSGKIGDAFRLGVLNIQTEADLENGIPATNHSMLAFQQKVFSRSNFGAFFINRQHNEDAASLGENGPLKYNRVLGLDYNLASSDNTYTGKFYAHKSFSPDDSQGNASLGATLRYNTRSWNGFIDLTYIDTEFVSDLGFIPRNDIFRTAARLGYAIWPKKGPFIAHTFDSFQSYTHVISRDYQQTDIFRNYGYEGRLKNLSQIEFSFNQRYTYLTDEFNPSRKDEARALEAGTDYTYESVRFQYQSNPQELFSFNTQLDLGEFFNGNRYSFEHRMTLRIQPKVNLGFNTNFDHIALPEDYGMANILLLSPRIEYTFNRSVFWSTLIQYSNQRDNLGINSRLQWRFAPLSDLFLVYNDNYFTTTWGPRGRSINLKLTYWLNI